jgi:hypothetical protein
MEQERSLPEDDEELVEGEAGRRRDLLDPGGQAEDPGELARRIAAACPGEAKEAEAELVRRFAPRIRLYGSATSATRTPPKTWSRRCW